MESQIKYELETELSAPTGGVLSAIMVTVEIEPKDAGCLIYGTLKNGDLGYVEVRGPKADVELPFSHPKIYVKYVGGLTNLRISTRGWRDSARG
jgi:hypothetical protein